MKIRYPIRPEEKTVGAAASQRGFFLLMLMFAVAIMAIALVALAPQMATQIKRDKEDELIHRGTEYARAIKKFYKKNHRYPGKIEDLENTNNVRYLRRRFKDPMTPDGKWKILTQADVMAATSNPNFAGSGISPLQDVLLGSAPSPTPTPEASPSPTPGSSTSPFGTPGGNPIGGGGIWGVASTSPKKSLHEFGNKANYNKWLFIYSVTQDMQRGGGLPRLLKGPYNPQAFSGANINAPGDVNKSGTFSTPGSNDSHSPQLQ